MMNILTRITCLLLVFIILNSCSEDNQSAALEGYFKLVPIQSSKNARELATSSESGSFNLGDLKASKEFYFLLQSTGGIISDITLETDNPNFSISPGSISELKQDGSIIPLITIGITHGIYLNGFGFTDILEMGEQSATLTIRGKTMVEGTLSEVESSFSFTVNAKVMDIKLATDNTEIDLTEVETTTSGVPNAGGLGAVRGYTSQSGIIEIENTGNVTIQIRAIENFNGPMFFQESVVPGDVISIDISEKNYTVISLDGSGTITDNSKIQMGNDGKAYFALEMTSGSE